jgi:hypothetical protein
VVDAVLHGRPRRRGAAPGRRGPGPRQPPCPHDPQGRQGRRPALRHPHRPDARPAPRPPPHRAGVPVHPPSTRGRHRALRGVRQEQSTAPDDLPHRRTTPWHRYQWLGPARSTPLPAHPRRHQALNSMDRTERTPACCSSCTCVPHRRIAGRAGYWLWLLVVLVVVAVAQRRLAPQLLGHDLDGGPGAAVLGRPCPLLEPAHLLVAALLAGVLVAVVVLVWLLRVQAAAWDRVSAERLFADEKV